MIEPSKSAKDRLLSLASDRGVETSRVIFGAHLAQEEHINRLALIDIFVDTYPCVGHTTATDALFQSIPVVTIAGETFASRVAASALHHIDCTALIAHSVEEYERIIGELIEKPDLRENFRAQIAQLAGQHEFYNTERYTLVWEKALRTVFRNWIDGEKPSDMTID